MRQTEFEKQLSRSIRKRRLIEGAITIFLLALGTVCFCLREATKEAIIHDGYIFLPAWEEVKYNNDYVLFITLGWIGAVYAGIFLLMDFLACRFHTIEKDLYHITVCRGMVHNYVYVDGVEAGRIGPFTYTSVVETRLGSGVRVTVSFQRGMLHLAHISFSDDTASIEL